MKAHIRIAYSQGAMATVLRRGDGDAGAVYIRTLRNDGQSVLFAPAPGPAQDGFGERHWRQVITEDGGIESKIDARIARESAFDPDIWVIEIEDREGRHFLEDRLITSAN